MMLRLVLVLIFSIFLDVCLSGQNRKEIHGSIINDIHDLKANKVSSITYTDYKYTNKDKKEVSKHGKIDKIELYDSLGREIETRFYDTTGQLSSKNKYFYIDTSTQLDRIEQYNANDSLKNVNFAKDMKRVEISLQVSYYKYVYGDKGLIDKAVFYYDECRSCSKRMMKPIYLTKLKYTFNP